MTRKETIKLCEALWSELIKAEAGYRCEFTCRNKILHSHHIVRKGAYGLRAKFDPENGICICFECHNMAHDPKREKEYLILLTACRGEGIIERLKAKHTSVDRVTTLELEDICSDLVNRLRESLGRYGRECGCG